MADVSVQDDGSLSVVGANSPEEFNQAICEYNKAHGTNYGWVKPAEGETDLSSKGRKVRDADVVQNPDGSCGIGKEYNKDRNNNQTSKVVQPNINNTNQEPDPGLSILFGLLCFFVLLPLGAILLIGALIKISKNKEKVAAKDRIITHRLGETIPLKEENYHKNDIREIKKLYDEGILTEEEFKKAKKKILDI